MSTSFPGTRGLRLVPDRGSRARWRSIRASVNLLRLLKISFRESLHFVEDRRVFGRRKVLEPVAEVLGRSVKRYDGRFDELYVALDANKERHARVLVVGGDFLGFEEFAEDCVHFPGGQIFFYGHSMAAR